MLWSCDVKRECDSSLTNDSDGDADDEADNDDDDDDGDGGDGAISQTGSPSCAC